MMDASNGLRNNSGKMVIMSIRIFYNQGHKGTKIFQELIPAFHYIFSCFDEKQEKDAVSIWARGLVK